MASSARSRPPRRCDAGHFQLPSCLPLPRPWTPVHSSAQAALRRRREQCLQILSLQRVSLFGQPSLTPGQQPQTKAMGQIFAAVESVREQQWSADADADADGSEAGPSGVAIDRGELRQLIQRAQNEVRSRHFRGAFIHLLLRLRTSWVAADSVNDRYRLRVRTVRLIVT